MRINGLRRVLVVDDEENIRQMLQAALSRQGLEVFQASGGEDALSLMSRESVDAVLCDIRMPGMSGLEFLAQVQQRFPAVVMIMMSAYGNVDTAIEAIKLGAYDYIAKPFKPIEAVIVLRKAEERELLKSENRRLRLDLEEIRGGQFGEMVARSDPMRQVVKTIRKVANYKTTVLIQGESGTGKELVARAIHNHGVRAAGSFVPVNCGAIPGPLLESELFGHRKGAFTDAIHDKKGLFAEASGGTLFLDEVGELPLSLQVKLLRVLQEEEVRPIGDAKATPIDVRVLAATVRDLTAEVKAGRFREDLFYRLNVLPILLSPLRERSEDIPPLIDRAVDRNNERLGLRLRGVSRDALKLLLRYRWPGNIRELENTIEHAMVLTDGDWIDSSNLPARFRADDDPVEQTLRRGTLSIKASSRFIEEALIRRALKQTGGNRTGAAKVLEISHRALLYKIKQYGIGDT